MSLKYTWKTTKGYKDQLINLSAKSKDIRAKLKEIGDKTEKIMKDIIVSSKVRPQDGEPTKLENNIKAEHSRKGWGVGNIAQLDSHAPYWAAVNYGANPHPAAQKARDGQVRGAFNPGESVPDAGARRTGRMVKGPYYIKDMKPIPAMNYIERTAKRIKPLFAELKQVFRKRSR